MSDRQIPSCLCPANPGEDCTLTVSECSKRFSQAVDIAADIRKSADGWNDGEWCDVQREDLLIWAHEIERLRIMEQAMSMNCNQNAASWIPIDSAPRDGQPVWVRRQQAPATVSFASKCVCFWVYWDEDGYKGPGFYNSSSWEIVNDQIEWMPK